MIIHEDEHMKTEIVNSINELKQQFINSQFLIREDPRGGAYVIIENVPIGDKYIPTATWLGFQIPEQYPYADIYPVFMGEDVRKIDGASFNGAITLGHKFDGRNAIQISRRNTRADSGFQKATSKILKVLDYLEKLK